LTRPSVFLFPAFGLFRTLRVPNSAGKRLEKPLTIDAIFAPWAAHRRAARPAHLVARWKASDLSGWRRIDGCGSRDGQDPRAGERGQDGKPERQQRLRAGPRPSRALQPGQLSLGAGLHAHSLRLQWPAVALRSAQRHRSRSRLFRPSLRRRSQVLSRWHPSRSSKITVWPSSAPRTRHAHYSRLAPAPNPSAADGQVLLNGEVDWVYEEELDVRSNYFWSPDSKKIAYLQMNETQVPSIRSPTGFRRTPGGLQRYPQPGDPNPDVHVGVVPARRRQDRMDQGPIHEGDDYLPRFGWVDSKTFGSKTVTRDHKHRALLFADAEYGRRALRCSKSATISSSTKTTT
jgi:hypothetical protein